MHSWRVRQCCTEHATYNLVLTSQTGLLSTELSSEAHLLFRVPRDFVCACRCCEGPGEPHVAQSMHCRKTEELRDLKCFTEAAAETPLRLPHTLKDMSEIALSSCCR